MRAVLAGKWDTNCKGEGMGGSCTQCPHRVAWGLRTSPRARDAFWTATSCLWRVILDENIPLLRK